VIEFQTNKMWWQLIAVVVNLCCAVAHKPVVIESEAVERTFHSFPKHFSFGASTAGEEF
jgi:hypothetical protein